MKTRFYALFLMLFLGISAQVFAHPHLLRLADRQVVGFEEILEELKNTEEANSTDLVCHGRQG